MAVPIVILATHQVLDTGLLSQVYEYTDANGQTVVCDFGSGLFSSSWQDIISGLGWGLGYFGMPHILVRFMSIEKPSMIKKSSIVAIVWVVISLGCAVLIAYMGRMLVADELLPTGAQKTVFMYMARLFFPAGASGLLLAAIIAASISTADSQLLVASSSFTSDLYKPIFRKDASDRETLLVGRLVVIAVAVIAYLLESCGSRNNAIMVGDTAYDVIGAKAHGIPTVGVSWGYGLVSDIENAGAIGIANTMDELYEHLSK
jgi:sodium/proline symporter